MAVISSILTAARVLVQQMAKQGVKKAMAGTTKSLARKKGRQILVQKARRAATRKAKEMAKEKAIEAVTGRKKSKKGELVKSGGRSKGGALAVQSKGTSALIPTGEVDGDAGSTAQVKGSGVDKRVDYGSLNKKIDNIVGITGALKKAFEDQNKNKKDQRDRARRLAEKERKAAREADLESKSLEKKDEKGPKIKVKGGDLLGGIMNFFTQILLGSLVLGFANLVNFAKKLFKRGNAAWEMLFWGVRAALGVFVNFLPTIGKAVRGLVGIGKRLLDGVLKPLKALGTTVSNAFKTLATKLSSFVTGVVTKAINFAKNIAISAFKAAAKGIQAAGQFIKNLPGVSKAFKAAKTFVGGVTKTATTIGTKVLTKGKDIVKTVGTKAKPIIGKVSQFVQKLFGSKVAKELAAAPTLTKGMAKASKGIKIPVLGPIMVAVSSLLSGDPIGKTLFKTAGAAIGGALGMLIPIPFLGMIIGEIGGEFVGDLLHELFMGGGIEGVVNRLKQKAKSILSGGKFVMDWTKEGFSRYWEGLPKFKIPDFPEKPPDWVPALGLGSQGKIWDFLKFALKFFMGPLSLLMGKEIPNIFWMLNPMNNFPLLAKSFLTDNAVMKGALENSTSPPKEEEPDEKKKKGGGLFGWFGGDKEDSKDTSVTPSPTSGTAGGRWSPLLNLISSVEGVSYDSVYPSTTKVKYSGGKPLYEMTIGEAHDWQTQTYKARGSAAAGKYQFMNIESQASSYAGLGRDDMFNAENQDKMAIGLIEKKRGVTLEMLKNNPAEAQIRISKEWAGIPVGTAMRGHKRQVGPEQSYYAGDGRNASGTSTAKVREAFAQVVGGQSEQKVKPPGQSAIDSSPEVTPAGSTTESSHLKVGNSISGFPVTSAFGLRDMAHRKSHGGLDIGTPVGTYVAFTVDAEILYAGHYSGYGYLVDAWLPAAKVQLRLAHLSEILVKKGDKIKAKTPVGRTGGQKGHPGAGTSTGPHLHIEADTSKGSARYGGTGDPSPYMKYLILSSSGGAQVSPSGSTTSVSGVPQTPEQGAGARPGQQSQSAQIQSGTEGSTAGQSASAVSSQASYEQGGTNNLLLAAAGASPGGGVVRGGGRGGIMAIDTAALVNRYNKSIIMGFTYKKT